MHQSSKRSFFAAFFKTPMLGCRISNANALLYLDPYVFVVSQLVKVLKEELRLAAEAEINRDFPLASQHLNQRILISPFDHVLWYEYGALCVRSGNWPKAEECLREALALDPRHIPSLLAYAVLLCCESSSFIAVGLRCACLVPVTPSLQRTAGLQLFSQKLCAGSDPD